MTTMVANPLAVGSILETRDEEANIHCELVVETDVAGDKTMPPLTPGTTSTGSAATSTVDDETTNNEVDIDAAIDEALAEQDENDESQQSSELPMLLYSESVPSVPYGGLSNLGNTCYMASALQMVASLKGFCKELEEEEPSHTDSELRKALLDLVQRLDNGETFLPDEFKEKVDERSPLFLGYLQQDSMEFLTTLLDLLDEDYKKKPSSEEPSITTTTTQLSPLDETMAMDESEDSKVSESMAKKQRVEEPAKELPVETTSMCDENERPNTVLRQTSYSDLDINAIGRLLHDTAAVNSPDRSSSMPSSPIQTPTCKLVGGRMNTTDVVLHPYSEFLSKEATATSAVEEETTEESDESCPKILSPVDRCFTTTVRVRIVCDSCKYSRSHDETYLHLPLEIGGNCYDIEDGLRKFFAPVQQELKCEKCFCPTATQDMSIVALPKVLLLNFKRFLVDVSPDYSSISYRKDQSEVYFGEELSLRQDGVLSEFMALECELPGKSYALRSVVNHIGSSASCGHYTADAKRDDEWIRFNDSFVRGVTSAEVMDESRQTAYMVSYELQ